MSSQKNRFVASLRELPGHIKPRYERLALITHGCQLDCLDPEDETVLIVSCDWLLWQQELTRGRHIVFHELGKSEWNAPDTLHTDMLIDANDWLYASGQKDVTVFRNVSLGRIFGAEMAMAMMNYHRLTRALWMLIERFEPKEILFFDFKYEINVLSPEMRKWVVESVAGEFGVSVNDRSGDAPEGDFEVAAEIYTWKDHGSFALFLLSFYSWVLETVTGLRCLFSPPERRVMVLVNSNMAVPLVQNFSGGVVTPIFIGRSIPKKFRLLWNCFRQGVLLVAFRPSPLSKADTDRFQEIQDALDRMLSTPADRILGFAHAYLREQVLHSGRLLEMAGDVKMVERLFERYRPTRIVVDGIRNSRQTIYIEQARAKNIAVDYIWHSPMTPQSFKMGSLGGDSRQPVFVTRCLSWGRTNERWLNRIEARQPSIRVGSPFRDKYNGSVSEIRPSASRPEERNVLLLQYGGITGDMAGLSVNMYENFIDTVCELQKLGYTNIRFKMHPGPDKWRKSYFEKIAQYFDIPCKILKSEPFEECLRWADIVIGPVQTGALFETLAASKPYHAFMLSPHKLDLSYFEGFPVLSSLDQLSEAMNDNIEDAARKLLDDLYSIEEIPSPSKRFWEVLNQDLA